MKTLALFFLILYPAVSGFGQDAPVPQRVALPDAPSVVAPAMTSTAYVAARGKPHTSFFAGRGYNDPAIRSNHEILHSRSYRLLGLAIWGSVGVNLARNWNNYKHDQPHGSELLIDAMVPAAVNSAMLFGSYKYIWAPIGVGTAGYGIFVNTRSAIDGVYF